MVSVKSVILAIGIAISSPALAADNGGDTETKEEVCEGFWDVYWSAYDMLLSIKDCQTAQCNAMRVKLTEQMRKSSLGYAEAGCDEMMPDLDVPPWTPIERPGIPGDLPSDGDGG